MKVKIVFQMISHMFCFFWGWVKLILSEDRNDLTKDCANHNLSYCLWKKSCTSWYGKYPIIYRLLYIPSGCLGFLPSTVWLWIGWLPLWFPKTVDSQFLDPGFSSRYPNQTLIVHLSLRSGKWPCVLLPSETSRVLVLEINACLGTKHGVFSSELEGRKVRSLGSLH